MFVFSLVKTRFHVSNAGMTMNIVDFSRIFCMSVQVYSLIANDIYSWTVLLLIPLACVIFDKSPYQINLCIELEPTTKVKCSNAKSCEVLGCLVHMHCMHYNMKRKKETAQNGLT